MKYKFIPHLFPTIKSTPKSWLNEKGVIKREYVYSRKTRLVDIRECWKSMLSGTNESETEQRNKIKEA